MSISQKIPVTTQGAEMLHQELHQLKSIQRPKVIQAIADARANGDLKENADYHAAREQQAFIEGRILELETKIANSQVIDVTKMTNEGKVIFGSTVVLSNIDQDYGNNSSTEHAVTYKIVGEEEADLKHNKVSVTSPIARALIGKYEGDQFEFKAPSGILSYEILKVEYI